VRRELVALTSYKNKTAHRLAITTETTFAGNKARVVVIRWDTHGILSAASIVAGLLPSAASTDCLYLQSLTTE